VSFIDSQFSGEFSLYPAVLINQANNSSAPNVLLTGSNPGGTTTILVRLTDSAFGTGNQSGSVAVVNPIDKNTETVLSRGARDGETIWRIGS
jgi:hypothetical protein